jgi:hypothetical protein
VVSLVYLVSRVGLDASGLPFEFHLDWMWLADPADLRDRLAETLLFFHAFPPGMNLVTGLLVKASGLQAAGLAHLVFFGFGLVFVNAALYLARAAGLPERVAMALVIVFSLLPATIYFEHLYLYEWPVAALLAAGAALFHLAVQRASLGAWLSCFLVLAAVSATRSTFHLLWFVCVAALGVAFAAPRSRRAALVGAIVPGLAIAALYAKNLALFGDFAASTFGPASYTLVTLAGLPPSERDRLIEEGRLSPFAAVSVYAPPREYARFFASPDNGRWPASMTRLEHTGVNAPNFNHWWLLDVHRARRADAVEYLRAHPLQYCANVADGVVAMFGPSTTWHPRDGTPASPHQRHRAWLGVWETWHNRVVHGLPLAPVGWYVLLPVPLIWSSRRARALARRNDPDSRARGALLALCGFQIVYVVAASTMLTAHESPRYRFQIEWTIWLVIAVWLCGLLSGPDRLRRREPGVRAQDAA